MIITNFYTFYNCELFAMACCYYFASGNGLTFDRIAEGPDNEL